ncbi:MAG: S9 family peptidase [Bryobacterales bacterium]|nr:S9 family peptidase [Bryobacterales bacterium]
MRLELVLLAVSAAWGQAPAEPAAQSSGRAAQHDTDRVLKAVDDLMWHMKLSDVAEVDKGVFTSTPRHYVPNKTAPGAMNPLIVSTYVFIPKKLDRTKKHPLVMYVHGGVHSNFMTGSSSNSAHIVRELVGQGYVVAAPEYRGSTGYGASYYEAIDYGGRENDDVLAARAWMLETYPFLDSGRVGIIGWSHGGMIALMNIFDHPELYVCAYAGVPVSDLVARLGYKSDTYGRIFSDKSHIGKTVDQDIQEYLRRSPITHVAKLKTPLLIHSTTNDEDVNVLEVRRLIAALKAEGKTFESKIYENAPGGHHFNRIDTKLARESRAEIYQFLARYLKP